MHFPFKINYKDGIAQSVEYDMGVDYKDNSHADNVFQQKRPALELLCDIVNATDPYHLFYLYEKEKNFAEAGRLLSSASLYWEIIKKETSYTTDQLLSDPGFGESYRISPLQFGWMNRPGLKVIIRRFYDEIFSFGVKYNSYDGNLIFVNDSFLSENVSSEGTFDLDMDISDFHRSRPISHSPLSLQLAYSPFQYQIHRKFDALCSELRIALIALADDIETPSTFYSLYFQSREFILHHLDMLLKKYCPTALIQNEYTGRKNDVQSILDGLPSNLSGRAKVYNPLAHYSPSFSDFLATFARDRQAEVMGCVTKHLENDEYIRKEDLENNKGLISSNNKIINSIYHHCPKDEYVTSLHYFEDGFMPPSQTISSVGYTNVHNHTNRIDVNAGGDLPLPFADFYNYEEGSYVTGNLDVLSVIYGDPSTPFLMPIFTTTDINIQDYLSEIDRQYSAGLYHIIQSAYENSDFSEHPYVKTDSIGMVISELINASIASGTGNIRRCAECHKFFIAKNGYEKYCDAPSRKNGEMPKKGSCSFKGKQNLEKERSKPVRQLYNLRRNQRARLDDAGTEIMGLKIDKNTNVAEAYRNFMFFLKQYILIDHVYGKERSFVCRMLSETTDDNLQAELKAYGHSFFPSKRVYKTETFSDLPTSESHICTFFHPSPKSAIDAVHITKFDWGEEIPMILKEEEKPHGEYLAFRDMMIKSSEKFPTLFEDLPDEMLSSIQYMSTLDKEWGKVLANLNVMSQPFQMGRGR